MAKKFGKIFGRTIGARDKIETNTSPTIDLADMKLLDEVNSFRVVPADMYMRDGGATPTNVPNKKGLIGISIIGDERFMNQLGTSGVTLKKTMYQNMSLLSLDTFSFQSFIL